MKQLEKNEENATIANIPNSWIYVSNTDFSLQIFRSLLFFLLTMKFW